MESNISICALAFVLSACTAVGSTNVSLPYIVNKLVHSPIYEMEIRPNAEKGEPVHVTLNIELVALGTIRAESNQFTVTCFLRQRWVDERLAYIGQGYDNSSYAMHRNDYEKIWTPDLFFPDLAIGLFHDVPSPNRLVRLYPDGSVLTSTRITLTLFCEMDLHTFPMDEQSCAINLESYGYPTTDLTLSWDPEANFTLGGDLIYHEYDLPGYTLGDCKAKYSTGVYSCLQSMLRLKRRVRVYILSVYIPSLLVVILSWMSFWVDMHCAPARISLSVITILTITTQAVSNTRGLFNTPTVKALDVWITVCLGYVFLAFVEYTVVNSLCRGQKTAQETTPRIFKKSNIAGLDTKNRTVDPGQATTNQPDSIGRRSFSKPGTDDLAKYVDNTMKIIFPVTFGMFKVIYWSYYLTASAR